MRKTLNNDEAAVVLTNTMEVIAKNMEKLGKMRVGKDIHPLFRLPDDFDPELGLDEATMARLLVEWMRLQGVQLVFDDSIVRENLDQGVSRLETLIPPG